MQGGLAPVVLLHSAFFNAKQFDPLQKLLAERECYAPTYRGQNGVARGERPITMETLGEDLILDLKERFAQPVHAVGNSMGAFVAVHACAQAPELFRSLTLVGATAAPEPDIARFAALEQKMRSEGPAFMAKSIAQVMFGKTYLDTHPQDAEHWTGVFAAVDASIVDTMRAVLHAPGHAFHDRNNDYAAVVALRNRGSRP